ncbi:MAG: hypothetical protein AAFU70_01205 [Planctomycetota bacterium]
MPLERAAGLTELGDLTPEERAAVLERLDISSVAELVPLLSV